MPSKLDLDLESLLGRTGTSLDRQKYVEAVLEYWWLVLLAFVLVTAAAIIYVKRATPIYQSRAVLLIEQQEAKIVNVESIDDVNMMDEGYDADHRRERPEPDPLRARGR